MLWINWPLRQLGKSWQAGDGKWNVTRKGFSVLHACFMIACELNVVESFPLFEQMFILNSWDPSSSKDSLWVQSWTSVWWEHGCVFCLTVSDCFFSSWTKCCWCYWWLRSQFHSTRYLVLKSNQWSLVPTATLVMFGKDVFNVVIRAPLMDTT